MARKILFEIEVENVGAARRIEALREEIRRLNKEIRGAEIGSPIFHDLIRQLTGAKEETAALKEQQKALNREFQAAKFPKDSLAGLRIEYAKLTEQIKILSAAERQSNFGQNLIKNAAGVKGQIDGIEQSIGRFTGNVGNYKSAFGGLASTLTGGLIGGGVALSIDAITRALFAGVQAAAEYGKALDRLSAITGVTGQDLAEFEDRANALTTIRLDNGAEIVNTATDIFEAFTLVGSARPELLKDAAALEEVTKQAITLAKASGDDLQTSVTAITTTLGQFKLGAEDSRRVINELAAGSKLGASEITDTTTALRKFGTTAAVTNISTTESIALIETLADSQLKGEEAGTQLRNILAKLAGADILPKNALRELQEAGVNLNVLKDTSLPLIDRLTELGKLQGNTAALTKTFGLENLAAAQIITQSIPKYQELVEGIAGTEEAFVQAGINSDNTSTKLENLQKKGLNALTNAFVALEPGINKGIDLLSGLIDIIATLTQAIDFSASALAGLAAPAISTFTILNDLFSAYSDSASAAAKATDAVADAQEAAAIESVKQRAELEKNISVLKSDVFTTKEKEAAIDSLLKAYPDYLKGIDLETASVSQLSAIQSGLNDQIEKSIATRKKQSAAEAIIAKKQEAQLEINRLQTGGATFFEQGTETKRVNLLVNEIRLLDDELDELDKQFGDTFGIDRPVLSRSQQRQLEDFTTLTNDLSTGFNFFEEQAKEAVAAVTDTGNKIKESGGDASAAGDEYDKFGYKVKKSKDEITAQAGSVAALKEEISKLEKQIAATAPGSPVLDGLIKKLDAIKDKLKETEKALLASTFKSLFGRELVAPTLDIGEQPELTIEPELVFEPDAKDKLIADAQAVKDSVEAALQAVEFKVEVPETDAEKKFREEREKGNKEIFEKQKEEEQKAFDERQKLQEQAKEAAFTSAQTIADSLTQIQSNRLQRETDAQLAQLDLETEGKIAAAQGNEAKIKAIEKDAAAKRTAIEKEAARERKKIAVKEALINTALAITRALTGAPPPANLILAGVAAAAGAAQLAVINSQEFAEGGVVQHENRRTKQGDRVVYVSEFAEGGTVEETNKRKRKGDVLIAVSEFADGGTVEKVVRFDRNDVTERIEEFASGGSIKRLKPGIITEPQNAPRTPHGDTVLAYLAPGEMVLNESQQNTLRSMFGQDAFALAGVPGESATRRRAGVPAFASGGVVGIVPQNGFAQQMSGQPVTVEAKAEFSGEQIDAIGQNMGVIIAAEVARQMRVGLAEGLFDANRRLEREEVLNQNRQG